MPCYALPKPPTLPASERFSSTLKTTKRGLWYHEKYNFEPSPTDPFHLFLLMKDLRVLLEST